MIREIKKNRELIGFRKFISSLDFIDSNQYATFYIKGANVFIFAIEHGTYKLTAHRRNILKSYGKLVSNDIIIKCIGEKYKIKDNTIL